jgi:CBS domain containing-hemolysin-like protein
VLIVLLALHAYFAAARESIAFIRKSRRLQLIEEGKAPAQIVDDLAEDVTHLLTTEQLALKFLGFFIIALAVFV